MCPSVCRHGLRQSRQGPAPRTHVAVGPGAGSARRGFAQAAGCRAPGANSAAAVCTAPNSDRGRSAGAACGIRAARKRAVARHARRAANGACRLGGRRSDEACRGGGTPCRAGAITSRCCRGEKPPTGGAAQAGRTLAAAPRERRQPLAAKVAQRPRGSTRNRASETLSPPPRARWRALETSISLASRGGSVCTIAPSSLGVK